MYFVGTTVYGQVTLTGRTLVLSTGYTGDRDAAVDQEGLNRQYDSTLNRYTVYASTLNRYTVYDSTLNRYTVYDSTLNRYTVYASI